MVALGQMLALDLVDAGTAWDVYMIIRTYMGSMGDMVEEDAERTAQRQGAR